jgi:hypothetical protein
MKFAPNIKSRFIGLTIASSALKGQSHEGSPTVFKMFKCPFKSDDITNRGDSGCKTGFYYFEDSAKTRRQNGQRG